MVRGRRWLVSTWLVSIALVVVVATGCTPPPVASPPTNPSTQTHLDSAPAAEATSHGDLLDLPADNATGDAAPVTPTAPTTAPAGTTTTPSPAVVPTTTVPAPRSAPGRYGAGLLASLEALAAQVPGGEGVILVLGGCYGTRAVPHWGYYNNQRRTLVDPDGAVVPPDGICLNPDQPDVRSSLLHEVGHRYFAWSGRWSELEFWGGVETAAECYAAWWGARTFGAGGCPAGDAVRLAAAFGWASP